MTAPLRVLLIEDSPTDAKLVTEELRKGGRALEIQRVETAVAMRAALREKDWDLVISDWSLPTFSGALALGVLKESGLDLPFILVSGTIGEEAAVEAMRAGAHDYVLKDKLGRLVPAVERELREHAARAERRRTEDALREAEARFTRLAESGIVGITIAETAGAILEANDTFLAMVGYTREDLAEGRVSWVSLTPTELLARDELVNEQLRELGAARPWEKEYLHKDGSRIPVLVGVAKLDGSKSISVTIDLTERKLAEVGRARAESALRQSEEQLRQAQKMEAVGRLAGGVAHDFNNVLSVILSYGEILLEELEPTNPMHGDVLEIRKAASRAAGLTSQLLTFSRQHVVEPKIINLNDVLVSLDKMLQRILGEDVELLLLPPKGEGRVKADPTHIEQVILNLVVNARDAMPTGGKLTVETANVVLDADHAQMHLSSKAGPHVMMAVTDTGGGMDRETQARIFEPFFTTKQVGKGTGLGLSTVFGIVQQSGGSIWVYSEVGRGTTFKVYLPRVDGEVEQSRQQAAPTTLRGTETILLVEDEEQVRVVVLGVLRRLGYQVLAAPTPGEALLLAETHVEPIHLLLTDVVMPQMSGPELARRLAIARPAIRVLCMSGYTDDSIVRHGVLDGGMAFLQKPITPATLAAKLRDVLDTPRAPVRP